MARMVPWYKRLPPQVFGKEPGSVTAADQQAVNKQNEMDVNSAKNPMRTMPMPSIQGGYTGKGPDGITQPDQVTPTLGAQNKINHENEVIFDSKATDNIGVDTLEQMRIKGRNGDLNVQAVQDAVFKDGGVNSYYGGSVPSVGKHPSSRGYKDGGVHSYQQGGVNATRGSFGYTTASGPFVPPSGPADLGVDTGLKRATDMMSIQPPAPQDPGAINPMLKAPDYLTSVQQPGAGAGQGPIDAVIGKKGEPVQTKMDRLVGGLPARDVQYPTTAQPVQTIQQPAPVAPPDPISVQPAAQPTPTEPIDAPTVPDKYDPYIEQGMAGIADIASGDSKALDVIANRWIQEFGGIEAAATGALKQEYVQAGYSPEQASTMAALRARDVSFKMGDMIGQFAAENATRAEQATRDLVTYGIQAQNYEMDKTRLGVDLTNQMYSEVASMDKASFVAKYKDQVGEANAGNIYDTARVPYDQANTAGEIAIETAKLQLEQTKKSVVGDAMSKSMEKAVRAGIKDWKQDAALVADAQSAFNELGQPGGDFEAWMNNNWIGYNTSAIQATKNQLEMNPDIQKMLQDPTTKESWNDMFSKFELMTLLGGEFQVNDDGTLTLFDPDGKAIIGEDKRFSNVKTTQQANDYMSQVISTELPHLTGVNTTRVMDYYNSDAGKEWRDTGKFPDPTDFEAWHLSTPDYTNVRSYLLGEGATLNSRDKGGISELKKIQEKVAKGETLTPEEKKIAANMPDILGPVKTSSKTHTKSLKGTTVKGGHKAAPKKMGAHDTTMKYDSAVYDITHTPDRGDYSYRLELNPEMREFFETNAGGVIEIGGKQYRIADDPFVPEHEMDSYTWKSGNDSTTLYAYGTGVKLIDLETQTEIIYPEDVKLGHKD